MYETNEARLQSREFIYNIAKWEGWGVELHTGQQFPGNDTVQVDPSEYVLLHEHPMHGRLYMRKDLRELVDTINAFVPE